MVTAIFDIRIDQMLAINEFRDAVYLCPAPRTPVCTLFTGNSILKDIVRTILIYIFYIIIFSKVLTFFCRMLRPRTQSQQLYLWQFYYSSVWPVQSL